MPEPRYFLTVAERIDEPPVSFIELVPSPSMFDELLDPLWWTPAGVVFAHQVACTTPRAHVPLACGGQTPASLHGLCPGCGWAGPPHFGAPFDRDAVHLEHLLHSARRVSAGGAREFLR